MGELVQLASVQGARRGREQPCTKAQVAAHFRVSTRTISRWMDRGMPFDKPFEGGSVRFRLSECDQWFAGRT